VLLHGYDQPAGGRWVDSAIPGKLGAYDRASGEQLWLSPCEVGYGRGFGAGFGGADDALVLGPSSSGSSGHRIARMALGNGELIGVGEVPAFDEAEVWADVCVCVSAKRVVAIDSQTLRVRWSYDREGERYHHIGRSGDRIFVVYTQTATKKQGVLALDAESGDFQAVVLQPTSARIHDLVVEPGALVLLIGDVTAVLSNESLLELLQKHPDRDAAELRGLALYALAPQRSSSKPLWFDIFQSPDDEDDLPEVSIGSDDGKLYVVRNAFLEVRDGLTGRALGEWAVPGLDERVAWKVCQGAGVLAEETRVSVFELPA
jgi:outer membrane protein assembly factor BamB